MTPFAVAYALMMIVAFGCAVYGRPLYRSHLAAIVLAGLGFALLVIGLVLHSGDTVCMCLPVKP